MMGRFIDDHMIDLATRGEMPRLRQVFSESIIIHHQLIAINYFYESQKVQAAKALRNSRISIDQFLMSSQDRNKLLGGEWPNPDIE